MTTDLPDPPGFVGVVAVFIQPHGAQPVQVIGQVVAEAATGDRRGLAKHVPHV